MNGFLDALKKDAEFAGVCLLTVTVVTLIACGIEMLIKRKNGDTEKIFTTRKIVMIGMFGAISGILYCFDFIVPFAPSFYKLDFSELPALIAGFAFGPVAGVMVEFVKMVVKLLIKSTTTAFVGDLANYLIGCMMVLPASAYYQFHKSKRNAAIGCAIGTITMTVFGSWFNAVYLLPTFSRMFGMPLDAILNMGKAINPAVGDLKTFVLFMVAPINIVKGVCVSAITMLIYKKISPIIKYGNTPQESVRAPR